MANALTIDISQFTKAVEKINKFGKIAADGVDDILNANAQDIVTKAKQLAPVDIGGMHTSISADNSKFLEKHITVNAFYAAFVEFGTGKYAAQYVSTLPATWQEYALQFKGQKGGGTLDDFIMKMIEWVKRKGIHGLTKSGNRKTGKKADADAYNIAYVIVISILRNGIRPHPFLFPAYEQHRPEIIKEIEVFLKSLGE